MIGGHVTRVLEPPIGATREELPFERQCAEDSIEGTNAVGDDDDTPTILCRVVVPNLAFVART